MVYSALNIIFYWFNCWYFFIFFYIILRNWSSLDNIIVRWFSGKIVCIFINVDTFQIFTEN